MLKNVADLSLTNDPCLQESVPLFKWYWVRSLIIEGEGGECLQTKKDVAFYSSRECRSDIKSIQCTWILHIIKITKILPQQSQGLQHSLKRTFLAFWTCPFTQNILCNCFYNSVWCVIWNTSVRRGLLSNLISLIITISLNKSLFPGHMWWESVPTQGDYKRIRTWVCLWVENKGLVRGLAGEVTK
jgi:hypothetical protein